MSAGPSRDMRLDADVGRSPSRSRYLLPLLGALFFASGASALIYQVVWQRLLGLVFGVTIYATSTVLASFMAGLALGSAMAAGLVKRARRPLLYFGIAELLIGACGLIIPAALSASEHVYGLVHRAMPDSLWLLTIARAVCALAFLLVPTTLMGATLPLVLYSSLGREAETGRNAAVLYAVNTAGAVVGAWLTGFALVGSIGMIASTRIAGALNIVVGSTALLVAAQHSPSTAPMATTSSEPFVPESRLERRVRRTILLVFAVSGLGALALEVLWLRLLVIFVPATTYAFTSMLVAVLAGIAAGSAAAARLVRRAGNWILPLAVLEGAVGLATLGSFIALAKAYAAGWLGMSEISFLTVFPASFLMGMAFPVGVRALSKANEVGTTRESSRRVAILYAVNVCGAIGGAIGGGFVVLPALGVRAGIAAMAALFLGSGLLLLWVADRPRSRAPAVALSSSGIVLFGLLVLSLPDPYLAAIDRRYSREEQLWWREEGVQTTATLHVRPRGGLVLYLDGLHQADDSFEMVAVHREIGHLAMALHPSPIDVAIIGLGGGATAGAVARHHGARVDIVELSSSVIRSAVWFAGSNENVLARPNVSVRVDDGRNYLQLTSKSYDVITADIIQPEYAGAGNLYSVEYFQLVRRALRDSGLMLQWIGHRRDTHYRLIMRTFLRVFPEATLWSDGNLIVGTNKRLVLDREAFERKLREVGTREALESVGLGSFRSLLDRYTAGPEELQQFVGRGAILTDDRPLIEFHRSLPQHDPLVDLSRLRGDVGRHVNRP